MIRPTVLVLAIVVAAACGPKREQAAAVTADSTATGNAFTDSATVRDSIGPAAPTDSVAAPGAGALGSMLPTSSGTSLLRDTATSKSAGRSPRDGAYIGRDSAFGPTFTVDSTGKVTPIVPPKKKP